MIRLNGIHGLVFQEVEFIPEGTKCENLLPVSQTFATCDCESNVDSDRAVT